MRAIFPKNSRPYFMALAFSRFIFSASSFISVFFKAHIPQNIKIFAFIKTHVLTKVLLVLMETGYFIINIIKIIVLITKKVVSLLKLVLGLLYKNIIRKRKIIPSFMYLKKHGFILLKKHSFISGVLFSTLVLMPSIKVYEWYNTLPDVNKLIEVGNKKSTRILDRNGKLLYEIYVDKNYNPVKLSQIPNSVIHSTLAIEDSEFYSHKGIRPLSMIRAAKASVFDDTLQGGSTITQQLVKNVLLSPEQTLARKLKEAVLSLLVEKRYSKDEILELYLNNISYGGTAWGIQSASQKYFGKNVWELSLAEASMLAGLPTAPSIFSPASGDLTLAKSRQKYVLDLMVKLGYISQEEASIAYDEAITIVGQQDYIRAPHFVAYIRNELETTYGKYEVAYGGLTVTTTLDLDLQEQAQEIVTDEVTKSAKLNISNGAALVLDTKSGEILAYVGSKDYFFDSYGSYDSVLALRQPGSSIKPVTYALALEKGFTPASIIKDEPFTYKNQWETYTPVNYDGKYHGDVTLRQALANSYNIPAVKLVQKVGPDAMVTLGNKLGLRDWQADGSYGLSVTLGGKEVRLIDLTNVYATFSRSGMYKNVTGIISVTDAKGKELYKKEEDAKQVISSEVSYLITDILSDTQARLPAFGVNNYLSVKGHTIAAKTGTTDYKRDNYTFGYTPSYVVGVWVGNNNNAPMHKYLASGLSGAAPIWNKIMAAVLKDKQPETFVVPANIAVVIDPACGNKREVFVKSGIVPSRLCNASLAQNRKDKSKERKS